MATVYSLVCENGSSGTYWAGLSAAEKARYGPSGSERVYGGLYAWLTARSAATDPLTHEYVEIRDAFEETVSSSSENISLPLLDSAAITITTLVNGVRSAAFHGGSFSDGYELTTTAGYIQLIDCRYSENVNIDGFRVTSAGTSNSVILLRTGYNSRISKMLLDGKNTNRNGTCLSLYGDSQIIEHCICTRFEYGVNGGGFSGTAVYISNCLAVKCQVGFEITNNSTKHSVVNCISVGSATENWSTTLYPTDPRFMLNNCGETGDTVWDTGNNTSVTISTSDFTDYANDDYTPAASSSPQVGSGVEVYNVSPTDIVDNVRPNYNPSGEENWDIGPFEYDHGNGLAPLQVSLTISGMVEGSVLSVYKDADGSAIISPTTITSSGSHSISYTYSDDTQITVKVRKASGGTKYLPYSAPGLITESGFSLIVNQIEDPVLN